MSASSIVRSGALRSALIAPIAVIAIAAVPQVASAGLGPAESACLSSYTTTVTAHDASKWKTTATDIFVEGASCTKALAVVKPYARSFCPKCTAITSANGYRYVGKRGRRVYTVTATSKNSETARFHVSSKSA